MENKDKIMTEKELLLKIEKKYKIMIPYINYAWAKSRIIDLYDNPIIKEYEELKKEVGSYEESTHPSDIPSIAEFLKFRRSQMMETQEEICKRAGISFKRWVKLEKGETKPTLKEAIRLHKIGIPVLHAIITK